MSGIHPTVTVHPSAIVDDGATIGAGSRVATLKVFLGDKPLGDYPVVALEAVPVAGIFGRAWDTLRLWFE